MKPAARSLPEWLHYQEQLHPRSIDLGLERVRAVAGRLGLLPLPCRSVIVGGTNGKGSTAVMIAAIAQAHGLRTGLFTSPHLLRYQERIQVDGVEVGAAELVAGFERIEAARADLSLTFFEFNTLAALLHFRSAGVELAVLEVGLGGRLDATNIVDADVAVLCSIGFDHRDWLGDTLEAIGREKAGIFRAGKPVVLGTGELPSSVFERLGELQCRVYTAGHEFRCTPRSDGRWDYRDAAGAFEGLPAPALAGAIQYHNAASAIAAVRLLLAPRALDAAAIARALGALVLPGRLQQVAGPVEWLLDVAHNPAAARVLAAQLQRGPRAGRTLAILGMLGDKDVAEVAAELEPWVDEWLLCSLHEPRGLQAQQLRARLGALKAPASLHENVAAACEHARTIAKPGDRVLVCGSFHTVGPALQWLGLY